MPNEFDILHSLISNRYVASSCQPYFLYYDLKRKPSCLSGLWICSGDYDLILDGIHENILHLHYHDPVMQKTVSPTY